MAKNYRKIQMFTSFINSIITMISVTLLFRFKDRFLLYLMDCSYGKVAYHLSDQWRAECFPPASSVSVGVVEVMVDSPEGQEGRGCVSGLRCLLLQPSTEGYTVNRFFFYALALTRQVRDGCFYVLYSEVHFQPCWTFYFLSNFISHNRMRSYFVFY